MGYSIYSCPSSVVFHLGGGTLAWENNLNTLLTCRNNYIMLSRNLPFLHALAIVPLRLIIDFAGCFYFLLKKKPGISKAIFTSGFAYFKWLLLYPNKKNNQPKGWRKCTGSYKGTIRIPYFIQNKKKFSELVNE